MAAFAPPSQLPCFFNSEMQEIEEAIGALDVLEDVTNIGAGRQKAVDSGDEFAIIRKDALAGFGMRAAARRPGTDACDITAAFAVAIESA